MLSKEKGSKCTEYSSVHFNSTAKAVTNSEFSLNKSLQKILYKIDNWTNERPSWIIESVNGKYLNISIYSPLIGNYFAKFPSELKNSKKGFINMKNNDNKCCLWCHFRHLNLIKKHPDRIKKRKQKTG